MKNLKVLVDAPCDCFAKLLTRYLIDSGHFVDVIDCVDNLAWQSVANYNLRLISKEALNESMYDFIVCFDETVKHASIPRLVFDLHPDLINIGLALNDKYLDLSTGLINYEMENRLDEDLIDFFTNIHEYFIDAVVSLMRLNVNELTYQEKSGVSGKAFLAYLQLDHQLQRLHQYYKTTDTKDTKFHFPAVLSSDYQYQSVDTDRFKWDQNILELFTLYLLMLYNGRQSGLYAYDVQTGERRISKYTDLNLELRLSQVRTLIDAPEYDIFHNPLYREHGLQAYQTKILVSYNASFKSHSDWILQLGVDIETNSLWISYSRNLYFFEKIESFAHDFCDMFSRRIQEDPRFYDVLYQEKAYYEEQLNTWNQTDKDYPKEKTLHELFSEQAKKTPNNIALVFEGQSLSYQQLDEQSNQLARLIQKQNPSELICLCLERSLEMVVSILAVLKAGCAYVPMDSNAPYERIQHMLKDTNTNLVISQSFVNQEFGIQRINVDKKEYLVEAPKPVNAKRTLKPTFRNKLMNKIPNMVYLDNQV